MSSFLKISAALLLIGASCKPAKQAAAPADSSVTAVPQTAEDKIVFLMFKISSDSAKGISNIELVNKIETSGIVKETYASESSDPNHLLIQVYDKEQQVKTIAIAHPLFKLVEYVKEDRSFGVKTVELKESEFFIRVQLKTGSGKVVITETLKSKTSDKPLTIKF